MRQFARCEVCRRISRRHWDRFPERKRFKRFPARDMREWFNRRDSHSDVPRRATKKLPCRRQRLLRWPVLRAAAGGKFRLHEGKKTYVGREALFVNSRAPTVEELADFRPCGLAPFSGPVEFKSRYAMYLGKLPGACVTPPARARIHVAVRRHPACIPGNCTGSPPPVRRSTSVY